MIGALLELKNVVNDLAQYINENIPEFSYADGNLSMETEEMISIEDIRYDGIDEIIIETSANTEEQKNQIRNDNSVIGSTIFFFKDEIILEVRNDSDDSIKQTYKYNDVIMNYTEESLESFNKSDFIEYLTSEKMYKFYIKLLTFTRKRV